MTAATVGLSVAPPARCDGCGTETSGATTHTSEDGVTVLATYCPCRFDRERAREVLDG